MLSSEMPAHCRGTQASFILPQTNTKPSLGFEASAAEAAKAKTSAFSGKGVPQHWQHEELFEFLTQQGWKDCQIAC